MVWAMFGDKKSRHPQSIQQALSEKTWATEEGIITNLPYEACIGTHGQGDLNVNYRMLKQIFGKPDDGYESGDYKIRKHWTISIDGVVCTIYDWKQGKQFRGYRPLKDCTWSVGGSHPISRRLVQGLIDKAYAQDQNGSITRPEKGVVAESLTRLPKNTMRTYTRYDL